MDAFAKTYLRDILVLSLTFTLIFYALPLKGEMCSTIISAVDGENSSALQKRAFSSFRSTCRRASPLRMCKYITEPSNPHTFIFIMGPLRMPFKLDFSVMGETGAMIALAERKTADSIFAEITIGGWANSESVIRACHSNTCTDKFANHPESGILSEDEYRPFWIEYIEGVVTVGKGGQKEAFSQWDAGAHHDRVTSEVYVGISGAKRFRDSWIFNTKFVCE